MRFRDDIDIANTWVYSDTHYGHENIVGFCHRPEEHEQVLIAEWRKVALPGRTMLHLGDLCYRGNAWFKHMIAKELTGPAMADRAILVRGNHDKNPRKFYENAGFKLARPFSLRLRPSHDGLVAVREDEVEGFQIIVTFGHYPWSAGDRDTALEDDGATGPAANHWVVHGHIHNSGYQRSEFVPFLRNHINVSVEQVGYKPVNLKTLLDGAILGLLPATQEAEDALAAEARERSIKRREEATR